MNSKFNYDKISTAYADLVGQDPSKRFAQYPWALAQLPHQLRGMSILDIGCGEGSLARILARRGAVVCGYDNSAEQVRQAVQKENAEPLGITYVAADPADIVGKVDALSFDIALSVAVLHYAVDRHHLESFFSSTFQLVKPGGFFAALVMNSDFRRYSQKIYNRMYRRMPDGRLQADFYDNNGLRFTADYNDYSRQDYESAAVTIGWQDFTWCPVTVTEEGKAEMGSFWDGFDEDCPYVGFRVVKPLE